MRCALRWCRPLFQPVRISRETLRTEFYQVCLWNNFHLLRFAPMRRESLLTRKDNRCVYLHSPIFNRRLWNYHRICGDCRIPFLCESAVVSGKMQWLPSRFVNCHYQYRYLYPTKKQESDRATDQNTLENHDKFIHRIICLTAFEIPFRIYLYSYQHRALVFIIFLLMNQRTSTIYCCWPIKTYAMIVQSEKAQKKMSLTFRWRCVFITWMTINLCRRYEWTKKDRCVLQHHFCYCHYISGQRRRNAWDQSYRLELGKIRLPESESSISCNSDMRWG